MTGNGEEVIRLDIKNTPTGQMFVSSDDVPGLYLWGTDPEQVFGDVIPVLKVLYRENQRLDVDVEPLASRMPPIAGERVSRCYRVIVRGVADAATEHNHA